MPAAARIPPGPMPSPGSITMIFFNIVAKILLGPLPAAQARRLSPAIALGWGGRGQASGRGGSRLCDGGPAAHHLVRNRHHVARAHLFRLGGKRRDAPAAFRQLRVIRLIPQVTETHPHPVAASMYPKNHPAPLAA